MKFPCELIAEPYIAQLRINIAHNLRNLDLTQTEIATLLQVSQPVVSGYLKKGRHNKDLPDVIVSKAREVAEDIAQLLFEQGQNGTEEAIRRGCYDCKILRQSGPTCVYHHANTNNLSENCTSCLTEKPLLEIQENKQGVITDLQSLFNYLISFQNINKLIPEIGLQIILSIDDPQTMSDIAAFPGRIIKRKRTKPIAETPIFGGSETTSQLLLELIKQDFQLRAIAGVKTTSWLVNRLKQLKFRSTTISGFEENMAEKVSDITLDVTPFIIVGIDSIGYESISYICTETIDQLRGIISRILG